MHEQDFRILEGQDITLPELGRELENITGHTIADSTGEIKRVIAHLPNFESDTDTFGCYISFKPSTRFYRCNFYCAEIR